MADDLPKDFRNSISDSQRLDGIPEDAGLFETLMDIEKKMILRALKITGNVQSEAAGLLGIGKSGLNKKLKKHDIVL